MTRKDYVHTALRDKLLGTYDDPDSEGNSAKYRTGKLCIECHERPAGTAWSPHWCQPCNTARMKRITRNLEEILAAFERRAVAP